MRDNNKCSALIREGRTRLRSRPQGVNRRARSEVTGNHDRGHSNDSLAESFRLDCGYEWMKEAIASSRTFRECQEARLCNAFS